MKAFGQKTGALHFYTLLVLILGIILTGCDFLMRNSEPPRRPSEDHFIPATSPEIVFTNLKNAFRYRDHEIYGRCFSDSTVSGFPYHFRPALVKTLIFPAMWDVSSEIHHFRELLAACPADSVLSLYISNDDYPDSDDGDSVSYQINYQISVHHTRRGLDNSFSGSSNISLVRDKRNYWLIRFWQDIPDSVNASWSDLKAYF